MTSIWEEKIYSQGLHINRYPFDRVVSLVLSEIKSFSTPLTALDLGSGTGNHLKFFIENGFSTTGIEQSPSAITSAISFLDKYSLSAEIIQGDIITPLKYLHNRSFSVILDRGSLTHNPLNKLTDSLTDLEHLLSPKGIFISYIFSSNHPSVVGAKEISKCFYTDYSQGIFEKAGVPALFLDEKTIVETFEQKFRIVNLMEMKFLDVQDHSNSSCMYEVKCIKK